MDEIRYCFHRAHKVRYPDEAAARVALNGCMDDLRRGDWRRQEVDVYYCQTCGGWHLTSQLQHPRRLERPDSPGTT